MITRYDPFRDALSLRRAMDQLFEQSFVNPHSLPGSSSLVAPMDICETPNGYEVDVALPGVRPEDIELTIDQNTLTIRGRYSQQDEHQNQAQTQQQDQSQAGQQNEGQQAQLSEQDHPQRHRRGHNWLAREIVAGMFERTVTFPRPIDPDNIQTRLENGILTVMAPVHEASLPRRISLTGSQNQSQPQRVAVAAGQRQSE